jgi:integrase
MARSRRSWGSVRALSSGRFQARYLDPETGRMVPAPQTFARKSSADRWIAIKRVELDRGTAIDEQTPSRPLADWWPAYWRSLQSRKGITAAGYERAWRLRISPRFGTTPVRRIKPVQIDEWIADLIAGGLSTPKLAETLGVLKRLLDRAVRDQAIPTNPCELRSVKLPKRPELDRPVLSAVQVERMAHAMAKESDRLIVRLLAYGGLRIGEALALEWEDIDFERRVVRIRRSVQDANGTLEVGPTKTHATRAITLPDALFNQLQQVKRSGPLVFPNRQDGYLRYRNWRRIWDRAVVTSGVTALPHDLRGTYASLLIDAGASVKDVQEALGHRDITTTLNIYARVRPGRSVDLAARLDSLIAEVLEPGLDRHGPVSRMAANPVADGAFTAMAPAVQRFDQDAQHL